MRAPASLVLVPPQPPTASQIVPHLELREVDKTLRHLVASATDSPEYWSFAAARNGYSHCYFRYPAMMVAEMQREIISLILRLQPNIKTLADPFAGSGTILLEAMFRGQDVYAADVNPLAILLCKAKVVLCSPDDLRNAASRVLRRALNDRRDVMEARFKGLDKWFSKSSIQQLSKLRRAIRRDPNLRIRRFLWVVLAETVRQTSRSRTSTYKLHIRPPRNVGVCRSHSLSLLKSLLATLISKIAQERGCRRQSLSTAVVIAGRFAFLPMTHESHSAGSSTWS